MFQLQLSESALTDLRLFKTHEQRLILDRVTEQLTHEPTRETRHRKALRPNELARWELRIDQFRVFYDVDEENQTVLVKAVGWKDHNTLFIRGREFPL